MPGCAVDGCVWLADQKAGAENAAVTAVATRVITSNGSRNVISTNRKTQRTTTRWLAVTNFARRDLASAAQPRSECSELCSVFRAVSRLTGWRMREGSHLRSTGGWKSETRAESLLRLANSNNAPSYYLSYSWVLHRFQVCHCSPTCSGTSFPKFGCSHVMIMYRLDRERPSRAISYTWLTYTCESTQVARRDMRPSHYPLSERMSCSLSQPDRSAGRCRSLRLDMDE